MKKYQRGFMVSCCAIVLMIFMMPGENAAAESRRRQPPERHPQTPSQEIPSRETPQEQQNSSLLQVELGAGLNIPLDDTDDMLDLSVSLHGTLLAQMINSPIKLEGDLGYWFLQAAEENDEDLDNPSLLTLTGGIRYYLNTLLHLDGGLGLYRFSDWDDRGYDDQSELGLYGGFGFEQSPFDFTVRIHYSDFYDEEDDFWNLGVSARVFF